MPLKTKLLNKNQIGYDANKILIMNDTAISAALLKVIDSSDLLSLLNCINCFYTLLVCMLLRDNSKVSVLSYKEI